MGNGKEPTKHARTGLRRKISRIVLLVLWVLFLVVVVIEGVVRFLHLPGLTRDELDPPFLHNDEIHRTKPHPYMSYCLKPNWKSSPDAKYGQKSHNTLGLRGPEVALAKPSGAYRIVCLGGSSTYGNTPTSDEATWPARLEKILRQARPERHVDVINAGAPGYSTFESLINLSFRMIEFKPDLVIVYHSINDMRCALYRQPVPDNSHWRAPWPVIKPSPLEALLEKSYCYLIWRKYCTRYLEDRADLNYNGIVDPPPGNTDWYNPIGKSSPQGFKNFHRNLLSIVAVARAHGAETLLVTQALDGDDIESPKSGDNQRESMKLMSRILKNVAAEQNVPLVDAEKLLEEEAARQRAVKGEENIFTWEVHLTDAGADLLARILAERILQEGWIP